MKWLCLSLLLAAACGSSSTSTSQTTPPPAPAVDDDPSCPLVVPGTSVSVEDTNEGAALVFVTTGDPLAVRARAAALAQMHNQHDGPEAALGMMFEAGWKALATEVEGGARVEFAAASAEDVSSLQEELRMHASHLTAGSCQM